MSWILALFRDDSRRDPFLAAMERESKQTWGIHARIAPGAAGPRPARVRRAMASRDRAEILARAARYPLGPSE
jgi:hypothetical protein